MISHYLKVALRLIKRSFLFSTINMLGFGSCIRDLFVGRG